MYYFTPSVSFSPILPFSTLHVRSKPYKGQSLVGVRMWHPPDCFVHVQILQTKSSSGMGEHNHLEGQGRVMRDVCGRNSLGVGEGARWVIILPTRTARPYLAGCLKVRLGHFGNTDILRRESHKKNYETLDICQKWVYPIYLVP